MPARLPDKALFMDKAIPSRPNYIVTAHCGAGGRAHVFRAYSAQVRNSVACKIIPRCNLVGADRTPPTWLEEVYKANTLTSGTEVKFWDAAEWVDAANGIDCIVLFSEYIEGPTLDKYIAENRGQIPVSFVIEFMRTMLNFLNDMALHSIEHGDLHSRNVLVQDRANSLVGKPYAIRVTDFGVASATEAAVPRDDFDQLAIMLKSLLENVDYHSASARDRLAYNILNDQFLGRHLTERDRTRDPLARKPRELYARLVQIDTEFEQTQRAAGNVKLATPFDYLNCEQIGEAHSLLQTLYSDQFLGLAEIETFNNLVLTGPRGCGKSTVFKSLSLKHRSRTEADSPADVNYIGVYYRCDDLYFAFPRYELPPQAGAYDIPLHYAVATLLAEVLETIELWGCRHYAEEFKRKEGPLSSKLWEMLSVIERPMTPDADTFRSLTHALRGERKRAVDKHVYRNKSRRGYFQVNALPVACSALREEMSFLAERPFFFFVDDYSTPKVTAPLQRNLNRLFLQRSDCCFYKLATESPVSFVREDIDKKTYVEGREFSWLNLGLNHIVGADKTRKLQFVQDVFARRLRGVPGYPVTTLEELIGRSPDVSYNDVARRIRLNEKVELCGSGTLCDLCSGDIHYLIELVRSMVAQVGGPDALAKVNGAPRVSAKIQSKAIREAAGNFLGNLRGIGEHGKQLVEVVTAFGTVALSHLRYTDSKNEEGRPPKQASRIEPYEDLHLSADAQKVYDELIRYSVFIEDPRGKSRRGNVVPRLHLRRFLIPHFSLTFSMRDPISLEPGEIEQLLLRPKEFEQAHRLKEAPREDVDKPAAPSTGTQQTLWFDKRQGIQ